MKDIALGPRGIFLSFILAGASGVATPDSRKGLQVHRTTPQRFPDGRAINRFARRFGTALIIVALLPAAVQADGRGSKDAHPARPVIAEDRGQAIAIPCPSDQQICFL